MIRLKYIGAAPINFGYHGTLNHGDTFSCPEREAAMFADDTRFAEVNERKEAAAAAPIAFPETQATVVPDAKESPVAEAPKKKGK